MHCTLWIKFSSPKKDSEKQMHEIQDVGGTKADNERRDRTMQYKQALNRTEQDKTNTPNQQTRPQVETLTIAYSG